ncbi:MAG: DUF192 domain-containing protein [Opitutae bacterium]|nr:DUF192 domain-containing protein [Opitutae bacterium]
MFSRLPLATAFAAIALALLTACGGGEADKDTPPKTVLDFFPIKIGARTVRMQIAALPAEQQQGLMFRKTMGDDEGMIFVFTSPQQMGFWMRNTTLPLDIGYIDPTGELKEIYPMYPLDERSVSSRSRNIQFCLEMNQGWFKANGVKPGDKLDLKALAEALKARGLKPEAAGLR